MSIDRQKLSNHLKDYRTVTGVSKDRFVCPITGREINESELINGHILNEGIQNASRKTVIQWGKLDHHYGTHVEPPLIDHLRFLHKSVKDRIESEDRLITLDDGTIVDAHVATSATGMHMAKKFAIVDAQEHDGTIRSYVLKGIPPDDPRLLHGADKLIVTHESLHEHNNAAALKAAYLLLFDILGYRFAVNPLIQPLRRTLADFFERGLKSDDVPQHFEKFMGALTPIRGWTRNANDSDSEGLDSIMQQDFLCLLSEEQTLFSLGVIFHVNSIWLAVWIPFGMQVSQGEVEKAWDNYHRFIADNEPPVYTIHPAKIRADAAGGKRLDLAAAIRLEEVEYGTVSEAITRRTGREPEPPLEPGDDAMIKHYEKKKRPH